MKKIFFILILSFVAINGCKQSTTEPTPSVNNISIKISYNRPLGFLTYPYTGKYYYSAVASISWNGGDTTVANQSGTTTIYVPQNALLTARYTETCIYTSGKTQDYPITQTFTATTAGATWTLD